MNATLHALTAPYPGLRPYCQEESALFFGRGQQVAEMLVRLDERRFLAVVGASGCGKSSLVRAGLLPALEQGFLASTTVGDPWIMVVIRPGDAPLRKLALELVRQLRPDIPTQEQSLQAAFVYAALRSGPKGLAQAVEQAALPDNAHVLILVDQFEELFRFRQQIVTANEEPDPEILTYREEATTLVSLLLHTAAQKEHSIHVVITMRSDFMGDCDAFHGLPEAINDSQFLTPRLERDQAEDAIAEPARHLGGEVEPKLVNRILNEIGNSPDHLPLMQHVLMRLWNQAESAEKAKPTPGQIVLGLEKYEALGGLAGALDHHAEEVFTKLTAPQQRIAEVLFRCLSDRDRTGGRSSRDTRRPTELKNIAEVANASVEQVKEIVEIFRAGSMSFLMPPAEVPLTPETRLDVTHESLLRRWKRVGKWVEDEAISAGIYRRLEETALKFSGDHLNHNELAFMVAWQEREKPNAIWAKRYGGDFERAMDFLKKSKEEDERRAAADREERKNKQWRNKMYWISGVASVGIILAGGLIIGWLTYAKGYAQSAAAELKREVGRTVIAKYKADEEALRANKEKDKVTIRALANKISGDVVGKEYAAPQRAVLFAAEASNLIKEFESEGRKTDDDTRNVAGTVLRKSLSFLGGFGFYGDKSETNTVAIFDLKDSPRKWLATCNLTGQLHLWEMWNNSDKDGRPIPIVPQPTPLLLKYEDGPPRKMTIAGGWLVVQTKFGKLRIWDLSKAEPKTKPDIVHNVETWDDVYISPHNNMLRLKFPSANKDSINNVVYKLWDLRQPFGAEPIILEIPVGTEKDRLSNFLSFTPDGRWFTMLLENGTPVFWDLKAQEKGKSGLRGKQAEAKIPPNQRFLNGEFMNDRRLVVCYNGGEVRIWERPENGDTWGVNAAIQELPTQFNEEGKEKIAMDVFTDRRGMWAIAVPKKRKDGNMGQQNDVKPFPAPGSPLQHQAELFDLSSTDLSKFETCGTFLDKFHDVNTYEIYPFRVHKKEKGKHIWVLANTQFGRYRLWDLSNRDLNAPKTAAAPGLASSIVIGGNLRIANLPSGDPVRFSADGRWLFQASLANYVVAWDLWSTNKYGEVNQCMLRGHDMPLADFCLSGDSRWLMSLGLDNTLRAWDLDNLSTTAEPREIRNPADLSTIDITPKRDWLAVSRQDGSLRLWNPTREAKSALEQSHTVEKGHKNEFATLRFSEDGQWLLAYQKDEKDDKGNFKGNLWDLRGPEKPLVFCTLDKIPGRVVRLIVSRDDKRDDKWIAATFANPVKSSLIALDYSIRLWHINASKEAKADEEIIKGVAHAFDQSSRQMIVEDTEAIEILDLRDRNKNLQKNKPILLGSKWTRPLVTPDGKKAIVFADAGGAILWDLGSAKKQKPTILKECFFREGYFTSTDGRWLVFKDMDPKKSKSNFNLWDLNVDKGQNEIGPMRFPKSETTLGSRSLLVSPDRRWLLAIQDPGKPKAGVAKLLDLNAPDLSTPGSVGDGISVGDDIETAAFSSDSRRLVTTTKAAIQVWDLRGEKISGPAKIEAKDNKGVMNASVGFNANGPQNGPVAFSPDAKGNWLAIAGSDGLIRVWDREKNNEPTVLHGHPLFSPFVLFVTSDGEKVISVDLDRNIIRISTVPMDGFLNLAKQTVGRKLLEDERK